MASSQETGEKDHEKGEKEKPKKTEKANPYDHPNYKGPTREEDEAVGWEPEPYRDIPLTWGPGPVFDPDDIPMPPHDYHRPRWMNADNPAFQKRKQELLLLLVGRPILIEKYGQTIHGLEYYGPRHNVVVLLGYTRGTGHV